MVDGDRALTIHDVIIRTAAMFVVLLAAAVVSWNLVEDNPWIVWWSLVVALVLGIVNAVKRVVSVPLILLYAAVEGVFLGGLNGSTTTSTAPARATPTSSARRSSAPSSRSA